jgi:electron transfer flavoprotein beta subunit
MISEILNINFVTNCVGLEIQDGNAKAEREIEGGKETLSCKLPMIIGGQKGLVEESDLKIPNMRGIMQARQKPLESIEPPDLDVKTTTNKFYKPKEKKEIKMLDANDLDNLIDLLHNEAKVL